MVLLYTVVLVVVLLYTVVLVVVVECREKVGVVRVRELFQFLKVRKERREVRREVIERAVQEEEV